MSTQSHRSGDGLLGVFLGLILGALGGILLGLLMAPKSGRETQDTLHRFIRAWSGQLNDDLHNPEGKTRRFFTQTRVTLEDRVDRVNRAIRAGRLAKAKRLEDLASGLDVN